MKKTTIIIALLLILIPLAIAEKHYELTIKDIDGTQLIDSLYLMGGKTEDKGDDIRGNTYDIIDSHGDTLYSRRIQHEKDSTTKVQLPYYGSGVSILVRTSKTMLFNISIMQYADLCGDDICQPSESPETCSTDCYEELVYEDLPPEPEPPKEPRLSPPTFEKEDESFKTLLFYILLAIILLFMISAATLFLIHNKNDREIIQYIGHAASKGYTKQQIAYMLAQNGYNVNRIFRLIEKSKRL